MDHTEERGVTGTADSVTCNAYTTVVERCGTKTTLRVGDRPFQRVNGVYCLFGETTNGLFLAIPTTNVERYI
jgi:hypothetical protein